MEIQETRLQEGRLYKLSEVSKMAGVPQSTLTRWARTGRIRARRMGRLWRMTAEDVRFMLENGLLSEENNLDFID